jgi:hypothetical protein
MKYEIKCVKFPADLAAQAEQEADATESTFSGIIRLALKSYLDQKRKQRNGSTENGTTNSE